jgi:lysophospholipase L1-like esterase
VQFLVWETDQYGLDCKLRCRIHLFNFGGIALKIITDNHRFMVSVLLLVCALVLITFIIYPPSYRNEVRLEPAKPISHTKGFEFQAQIPDGILTFNPLSDDLGRGMSPIRLLENNLPIGPANAFRDEIQQSGMGKYLHSSDQIFFSSSDNSDPRTNGKQYHFVLLTPPPPAVHFVSAIIGYFAAIILVMAIVRFLGSNRFTSFVSVILVVLVSVLLLEAVFWVITENQLARHGSLVQKAFSKGICGIATENDSNEPGLAANYVPHHYLNYALNPERAYCGIKQFNSLYKIRRTEPIESDKGHKWRALVVGGSTTFCEGIRQEENTWPHILESIIRNYCGPDTEVMNGGIGGYTLLENFIHYVALLSDLKPDLVLFYTGINDVHPRLFGTIMNDYSNYRVPWRLTNEDLWYSPKWLSYSKTYQYYYLNKTVLHNLYQGIGGQVSKKGPQPTEWRKALSVNDGGLYKSRLQLFIKLLKSQGIKVAVIPQHFVPRNERDGIFFIGVEEHNQINKEVSGDNGTPFMSELLSETVLQSSDTFDSCHFNEEGSRKMAAAVYSFLQRNSLLPNDCLNR